ncbi:hypothetical protein H7F51_03420 [Novosphingobium flavum]|uniref:Uncharacterized protein n=1 Tax=Novosphingobium flavum TaxID=1778672 RepID=A0A7X1FPG3_9SPHN|nr:hypothetical protein [Novosphingobium flavum]MBC2664566.1 hypothetical protein [Novosphingobium flavum]
MALVFVFLLGIVNFAMHRAVLASGHPILAQVAWLYRPLGGRFSLIVEFMMLLGSMLLVSSGSPGWAWGYAVYTAINAVSAWLILTRRL